MSKQLTEQYIAAFSARDLAAVGALLADDFAIEDPVIKRIEGKAAALDMMKTMFGSCKNLSFKARNIYVEGATSLIEFTLDLDATHLEGVDIIEWRDGKMLALRAYLDIPKG
jgi:ketosteroid isomerase-like protein